MKLADSSLGCGKQFDQRRLLLLLLETPSSVLNTPSSKNNTGLLPPQQVVVGGGVRGRQRWTRTPLSLILRRWNSFSLLLGLVS